MHFSIPFTPIEFHAYSGNGWSTAKLAIVTGKNGGEDAQRETAIKAGFKSEHALEMFGDVNRDDKYELNGETFYGRKSSGLSGDHTLSAKQIARRKVFVEKLRACQERMQSIDVNTAGDEPAAA